MSGETRGNPGGKTGIFLKEFFFRIQDSLFLGLWIGGIFLVGGVLWFLTQPPRVQALQNSVNRILVRRGDSRLLGAPIPRRELKGGMNFRGNWYYRGDSPGRALIFSVMDEGVLVPCAAMVSPEGLVEEVLILAGEGGGKPGRLSPALVKTYVRRIEGRGKS